MNHFDAIAFTGVRAGTRIASRAQLGSEDVDSTTAAATTTSDNQPASQASRIRHRDSADIGRATPATSKAAAAPTPAAPPPLNAL